MSGFGGYGTNHQPPFGAPQQGFGGGSPPQAQQFATFGQQQQQQQQRGPFGSSPPPAPSFEPFGQSASTVGGGFAQSQQQPASSTGITFGSSPNVAPGGGFQQPARPTGGHFSAPPAPGSSGSSFAVRLAPFPNSNYAAPAPVGFASPAPFPPSTSMQQPFSSSHTSAHQGPFTAAAAPTMSFAMSSNVMSTSQTSGWDTAAPATRNDSLPFLTNRPSETTSSGVSPFGSSDEMADEPAPARNLPFGTPEPPKNDNKSSSQEELLSRLKAKKEKLRRLEEKKKKGRSVLDANAPSFQPTVMTDAEKNSVAEKNAIRFATNTNQATRSLMPKDLMANKETNYASLRVDSRSDREDLETAVSLVGTCPHFCPDEELLRRERESDIQLLETPLPGKLHPAHWTLRNTVVKRFRRSAADYKLDVPEWVRPPDVLERVCGYLEEWVMERDRQGPDPRFPNSGIPPPLDVYQFIWDRTRMIRKDFTLQNYVGTGGNCDARAVRCHERICRWHAMCEHQLSHIPDFVTMQSQQNIQELGQTMKTLNQFYDDSLGRSMVEVPDANGTETRLDLSNYQYGCTSDVVQGVDPVDYDGTPLTNTSEPGRLIQAGATNQTRNHGTAEPEMRGLYILLTIDNDGGMEVLKYAARLYRDRPKIYYSPDVQLALAIYKAKKEYNYARFFSILRAPSTPYLFACIMFKYVETMRKVGFRIFSKTYGGRSKETNEPIYDSYPLKTLARVLCFEDMDEARHACQHYNITVKEKRMDSPSGVRREEIVHWRRTPFKEPKDPSKGTIIPLKPRKMIRTIEGKLRGAPRLAVCRGAVSGAESSELISTASSIQEAPPLGEQFGRDRPNPEGVANKADDDLQAAEKEATKSRVEKEQLQRKLKQRDEERKKLLLIREQRAQEAEHELRAKAEKEREAQRLQTEQEKERRNAAEKKAKEKAKRLRAEAAAKKAQEAKRKADEEHRRLEAIKEKERLAQQEQRRIEEERQLREAEELLRRQELEVERRRLEAEQKLKEERKRIREAELRKQKLERDAREQAALQSHLEWQAQAVRARKKVLWRRWLQKVPLQLALLEETHESLSRISEAPTDWISCAQLCSQRKVSPPKQDFRVGGIMNVLSALDFTPFPLESMVSAVAERFFSQTSDALNQNERGNFCKSTTFLFKVAVFFPSSSSSFDKESRLMLQIWMKSQLRFGRVLSAHVAETDVRVVFIDGTTEECGSNCDAAMVVSLDCFSDSQRSSRIIAPGVPVVALLLPVEHVSGHPSNTDGFSPVATHITRVESMTAAGYKEGFQECVEIVFANLQIQAAPSVECVSVMRLCALCISRVIWLGPSVESPQGLVESARQALFCLLDRLEHCASAVNDNWPAAEFFSGDDVVKDYFGKGQHLPRDWAESTRCGNVARAVKEFARLFDGTLSLSDLVARLVHDSPDHVQRECAAMLDVGLRRRYLQTALEWKTQHDVSRHVHKMYMPVGFLPDVLAEVSVMCKKSNRQPRVKLLVRRVGEFAAVEKFTAPSFSFSSVEPKYEGGNRNARHGHAKPSLQEPETSSGTMKKRQRTEVVAPPKRTKSIEASEAFTKRLKSMAQGTPGKDMLVGRKTLSGILRKSLS